MSELGSEISQAVEAMIAEIQESVGGKPQGDDDRTREILLEGLSRHIATQGQKVKLGPPTVMVFILKALIIQMCQIDNKNPVIITQTILDTINGKTTPEQEDEIMEPIFNAFCERFNEWIEED